MKFGNEVGSGLKVEGLTIIRSLSGSIKAGKNLTLGSLVNIASAGNSKLVIGNNVSINQGSYVICLEHIHIGDNVRIGEYCSIRDNSHEFSSPDIPIAHQGFNSAPIIINNNAWIGRMVTIMPGVTIGQGAIVGANSVVTKTIPDMEVWAGVPAKKLYSRQNKAEAK